MLEEKTHKGRNSRTISIRVTLADYADLERAAFMARRSETVGLFCKRRLLSEIGRKHRKDSTGEAT